MPKKPFGELSKEEFLPPRKITTPEVEPPDLTPTLSRLMSALLETPENKRRDLAKAFAEETARRANPESDTKADDSIKQEAPAVLERFSVVWKEADSNLSARFYVPGFDGYLPFFISGSSLERLERAEPVELTEWQLLAGILCGLPAVSGDTPERIFAKSEDRQVFLELLDKLSHGFDIHDPEMLILDVGAKIRRENGSRASRMVMLTGLDLNPFSSRIRSDLICDTWAVAAKTDDPRRMIASIPDLVEETLLSEVIPAAKEVICYYGLCALVKLDRGSAEIEAYLTKYIYPNVEWGPLKIRIKQLLENPKRFTIKMLELDCG